MASSNYAPGWKFHPTDEELIGYYLQNRAEMGHHFFDDAISECPEFYGQTEPWIIWDKYGGSSKPNTEVMYFFTLRHKMGPKHFNRKVGSGTWSGSSSKKVYSGGKVIGIIRHFRYEGGFDSDQNEAWLMDECEMKSTDVCVLCVLRKSPRKPPPSITTPLISSVTHDARKRKRVVDDGGDQVKSKAKTARRMKKNVACCDQDQEQVSSITALDDHHPIMSNTFEVQSQPSMDDYYLQLLDQPAPYSVDELFAGPTPPEANVVELLPVESPSESDVVELLQPVPKNQSFDSGNLSVVPNGFEAQLYEDFDFSFVSNDFQGLLNESNDCYNLEDSLWAGD